MKYLVLLVLLFSQQETKAQFHDEHEHESHSEHAIELGIGNGLSYSFAEKEPAYVVHMHAIKAIGHSKFGLGLGYERIFDEHGHNSVDGIIQFRPIHELAFNYAPGIGFDSEEVHFANHFEVIYEFVLGHIHLGPIVGYGFSAEDSHFSLGLHIGLGI